MADLDPAGTATVAGITLPKSVWIIGGAALTGGAYLLYRRRKAAQAAAATSTDSPANALSTGAAGPDNGAGYNTPVTILPIFQGTQPPLATPPAPTGIPDALSDLTMKTYTVTGKIAYYAPTSLGGTNPVTDRYPGGAAAIVYGLAGNPHNPDVINIASETVLLTLANPGKIPPYAVGTKLQYPAHPETLTPAAAAAAATANQTTSA